MRICRTCWKAQKRPRLRHIRQFTSPAAFRDHRAIANLQKLYVLNDHSPGAPFFLPHGTRIFNRLVTYLRELYREYGFEEIITPQMYKQGLWTQSGHEANFADDMFTISTKLGRETDRYRLKPMNCPGHCLLYGAQDHSYRDLPIRYADFSPLHRDEVSGSLSGLTRVRRFHQDDAHVFCAPEQLESEIHMNLQFIQRVYHDLNLPIHKYLLSSRPQKFIGELDKWTAAEEHLERALAKATAGAWEKNEGDGAFYGPKIDVIVKDMAGKLYQTATVQLDFQLPQRFKLKYHSSNLEHPYLTPVMVHRAVLGSVERAMAILIEQTQGNWPFWLSPRHAIIVPINDSAELVSYAREVQRILRGRAGSRQFWVDIDDSAAPVSKRVQLASQLGYNTLVFIGKQEMDRNVLSFREREAPTNSTESLSAEELHHRFIETDRGYHRHLCN